MTISLRQWRIYVAILFAVVMVSAGLGWRWLRKRPMATVDAEEEADVMRLYRGGAVTYTESGFGIYQLHFVVILQDCDSAGAVFDIYMRIATSEFFAGPTSVHIFLGDWIHLGRSYKLIESRREYVTLERL